MGSDVIKGPNVRIDVSPGDVEKASSVRLPSVISGGESRRCAVLGSAILDKLRRRYALSVANGKRHPYVVSAAKGKIAVSVMVSAVRGACANKHMIIPVTSLKKPRGTVEHVLVCAFTRKLQAEHGSAHSTKIRLVGWTTAKEAVKFIGHKARVVTPLKVIAVPVTALKPMHTLRYYASNDSNTEKDNEKTMPGVRPEAPGGGGGLGGGDQERVPTVRVPALRPHGPGDRGVVEGEQDACEGDSPAPGQLPV